MRLFPGICAAHLILVMGFAGEASAACCVTATHVYVPPPTHVVVPHTYVHPVTPQVHVHAVTPHPHAPGNTWRSLFSASTTQATSATRKPPHRIEQPIVVTSQEVTASSRCKRQGGDGCKKKDEELTGWAKVRHWLHLDNH